MDRQTLDELKAWFAGYVASFYTGGADVYLDEHYRLKENHTYLVCEIARRIAERIGLEEGDVNLAEAAGLLHDTGRFEQFRRHRTYVDFKSVNHGTLGLEVLREARVLERADAKERAILEKTVELHGVKELPEGLDERTRLFCRLIRDADKVDIYRVMTENLRRYYADPKQFPLEVEFPDEPRASAAVVENLRRREPIDYHELRTLLDAQLLSLGWVYDVNFAPTLEMIRQDGWWEELMGYVPDTEELAEVKQILRDALAGKDLKR